MIPPRSPYGLIQEDLWPDEFHILVACMLLNCTTRRAVEKVMPRLFDRYPDAPAMAEADVEELSDVIGSLGFRNRRAVGLVKMSKAYLRGDWHHASELPGVGPYAAAAWDIFCKRRVPIDPPKDHALVLYHSWWRRHYGE